MKYQNKKGFTLLETIINLIIIGMILNVAIFQIKTIKKISILSQYGPELQLIDFENSIDIVTQKYKYNYSKSKTNRVYFANKNPFESDEYILEYSNKTIRWTTAAGGYMPVLNNAEEVKIQPNSANIKLEFKYKGKVIEKFVKLPS